MLRELGAAAVIVPLVILGIDIVVALLRASRVFGAATPRSLRRTAPHF